MENIILRTESDKKKVIMYCAIIAFVFIGIFVFLFVSANSLNKDYEECIDDLWSHYEYGTLEFDEHMYLASSVGNKYETVRNCMYADGAIGIIIVALVYLSLGKSELTISDKRVYGKAFWGKRVDIPLDSISSIGKTPLSSISIASSSGKIFFVLLEENEAAYEEVSRLLVERQSRV